MMNKLWNRSNLIRLASLVFLFVASYAVIYVWNVMPLATGHSAKMMCSHVFLSERHPDSIKKNELAKFPFNYTSIEVDHQDRSAQASLFGFATQKASFKEGFGCSLVNPELSLTFLGQTYNLKPRQNKNGKDQLWPLGEKAGKPPVGLNVTHLMEAIQEVFEPNGDDPHVLRKSSAVIVVYDGQLIAEKYAHGVTSETRHISWSIAKSLTNAIVGLLVYKKDLKVTDKVPIDEWQKDERRNISYENLLCMDTGLDWLESYTGPSAVNTMMFRVADMGNYAMRFPLKDKPGENFMYSSGTTAILSSLIREHIKDENYHDFIYENLFDKIGMSSLVFETDPVGTYVGSSYAFATARDYARFGLLYYQDGMWNGERVLPEGWVDFSTTPTKSSEGRYGAKFWLNAGGNKKHPSGYNFPSLPRDTYAAIGLGGQYIIVVPSKKLVVVRMAFEFDELSRNGDQNMLGMDAFVKKIIETLPQS